MSQIIIPGYYIIFRNDNNGIKKEQFVKLDDLIISGPTNTNVNDFRAILIT